MPLVSLLLLALLLLVLLALLLLVWLLYCPSSPAQFAATLRMMLMPLVMAGGPTRP
jgi:hypothetical protein